MENIPKDIYTEPEPAVDTLANLGPLTGMAGIWVGTHGLDVNPKPNGPEKQAFIEHMELQGSMPFCVELDNLKDTDAPIHQPAAMLVAAD